MNDAIIIQQVFSNSECAEMLKLTAGRNVDYCLRHKIDFSLNISDIQNKYQFMGDWPKVWLVNKALKSGYKYVFWLDADSAIVDPSQDLRSATDEGIGACWHVNSLYDHWNTGVMYFVNSKRVLEFMESWIAQEPSEYPWYEQTIYNEMARDKKWEDVCKTVDDKWNATPGHNWVDNPVVKGWHGYGSANKKLAAMKIEL